MRRTPCWLLDGWEIGDSRPQQAPKQTNRHAAINNKANMNPAQDDPNSTNGSEDFAVRGACQTVVDVSIIDWNY